MSLEFREQTLYLDVFEQVRILVVKHRHLILRLLHEMSVSFNGADF